MMSQYLMNKQLSSIAIAASLLAIGCNAEQVSTAPSSADSPTEQPTPDTSEAASSENSATGEKTGTFIPAEVPTSGTIKLSTQDGKTVLELDEAFKTSDRGPDLVVVLHQSADVVGESKPPAYPLEEGDYVYVADLKAFSGTQTYTVPAEIDVSQYKSVAIWCRKFNATFGAATLQ